MMAGFLATCAEVSGHWEQFSLAAIERIQSRYTWQLYAERMMTLARVYGFWKYVTNLEREETRRYLEMLYGLQFRRVAEQIPH
jgi:sucrose synthase